MESSILYDGRIIARRPSWTDDYIAHEVFEAIRPELAGVLGWSMKGCEEDWKMLRDAFTIAVRHSLNGERIAQRIRDELRGICLPREDMAEIFERAPFDRIIASHVEKWRTYFRLEPTFAVGDTITFRAGWDTKVGTIADIRDDAARYGVIVDGDFGKYLVKWEEARSVDAPATAPESASPRP